MSDRRRCLAIGVAMLLALVAPRALADVRVVDDSGSVVALRAPARRIVTLAPHATELAFAAGAGAAVVGVIKGSDYPPAAQALPAVGDAAALDVERIVVLAPDLIVTWPWTMPAQVALLRARGIAVFEANPKTIDGIAEDMERLGELSGTRATASAAAAAFRARIAGIPAAPTGAPALSVFYQVSDAPLFTLGGHHLVSEAIARCGGRNVFDALTLPAPQVNVEAVLAADPQVILAGTDNAVPPVWLDDWLRWPAVAAVRRHALYAVDANLLHRPGPRFADGVVQLCDTLSKARRTQP